MLKRWGMVAAPCASVGGFICDVLTPMGPVLKWVLFISLAVAVFSGAFWFLVKRGQLKNALADGKLTVSEIHQLTRKNGWAFSFAFSFCNVIIISLLLIAQSATGSEEKGLLAEKIPGVEAIQASLFRLEHSVGNIDRRTQELASSVGRIEAKLNTNPKAMEKLRSIESYDFPGVEGQLRKIFKRTIDFQLERESFASVDEMAAQDLGTTVQDMLRLLANMSANPTDKEDLARIERVNFRNNDESVPSMQFENGTLTIAGSYGALDWSSTGKMSDMIRTAVKNENGLP